MHCYDLREIEDEIFWCYSAIFEARGYTRDEINKNYDFCKALAQELDYSDAYLESVKQEFDREIWMIADSLYLLHEHEMLTARHNSHVNEGIIFDASLEEIRLRDGIFVTSYLESLSHQIKSHVKRLRDVVSRFENRYSKPKYGMV